MKNLILVTDQSEVLELHMWSRFISNYIFTIWYFAGFVMLLSALYNLLDFILNGTPLNKIGGFYFAFGFSVITFFFTWVSKRYAAIPYKLKLDMTSNEIISSGFIFKLKIYRWKLSEVTKFDTYSVYVKKWPSESELIKKQNETMKFEIQFHFTNPRKILWFANFFMEFREWDLVRDKIVLFFKNNGFDVSKDEIGTGFTISRKN